MINLVYERANKDAYDMITAMEDMYASDELGDVISNTIFPAILNKVGDTIIRGDIVDRNYANFKLPLKEYGAITEYLASNMIKADNASPTVKGTVVDDFVVNNPDIQGLYAPKLVRANYPLTINTDRWLDAIDSSNVEGLSSMMAIAMQSLYDGVTHDHDSFIPALFGSLFTKSAATSKKTITAYEGTGIEAYSKNIFALLNKSIRDMTQWRRSDFNYMGMEMSDSKRDLALVFFDSPVGDNGETILDVITSQLTIGPMARAAALGEALGVSVYEMPPAGVLTNATSRAYGIASFPGMQTADITGERTEPFPLLKFALVGKGALNVGLKRLQTDTGRSVRGHFDQTWVQPTLQLAYGAGQAIFFSEEEPGFMD
jgi:hypothetical protein